MVRKGFGPRLGANLIDVVILIVVLGIVGLVFGMGFHVNFGVGGGALHPGASMAALVMYMVVTALIRLAYVSTEIFMAATPGHMALGMKITRADGSPADQATLIKRFVIRRCVELIGVASAVLIVVPIVNLLVGLVGLVAAIFIIVSCFMTLRVTKLALHDDLSGTAIFGPGTEVVPSGFPVQPVSTATTNVPPPTAPVG